MTLNHKCENVERIIMTKPLRMDRLRHNYPRVQKYAPKIYEVRVYIKMLDQNVPCSKVETLPEGETWTWESMKASLNFNAKYGD